MEIERVTSTSIPVGRAAPGVAETPIDYFAPCVRSLRFFVVSFAGRTGARAVRNLADRSIRMCFPGRLPNVLRGYDAVTHDRE